MEQGLLERFVNIYNRLCTIDTCGNNTIKMALSLQEFQQIFAEIATQSNENKQ